MASNNYVNVKLSWEFCPPELLHKIFKKLDYRSLINCITVNKIWKDVAVDYIEFHGLWVNIVSEVLINKGATLRRKCKLNSKDILINALLWLSVRSAQIKHYCTCSVNNIKKMHIFKDTLIVKTDENVKYFDLNLKAIRCYQTPLQEIDWTENDFMRIGQDENLINTELHMYRLRLYGKSNPDDCGVTHVSMHTIEDVLLYRLEDNICYIVARDNIVWALIWDGENWHYQLRGRYYGNSTDTIYAIHVFHDKIFMVTKYGKILKEDKELMRFMVAVNHSSSIPSNWMLFNESDVAVSVPENVETKRIKIITFSHMKLECAGMSCATEHGEILFLGFKDGVVAICRPYNMRLDRCEPELCLNVKDYDKNIKDPTVIAIEVFEDKLAHHLFIATPHQIFHLILTYPLNVTAYYD